jgi:hypothetical protein
MTMIKNLAAKMLAILGLVAFMTAPATAQSLSSSDLALAFGGNAPAAARSMNAVEMDETEGRWAKVVVEVVKKGVKVAKEALKPKDGQTKNARKSTEDIHEKGDARRARDNRNEKGDARRPY